MVIHWSNKSVHFLWIALTLFVILTIALLLPIYPNDYWWYIRLGKDIVFTGSLPSVDTYSFTQNGQPVVYHSWLSAVFLWLLQSSGGTTLTVLVKSLIISVFYLILWFVCKDTGANPRVASIFVLLSALATSNNWVIRPQIFAYPLFGLSLWILMRWQKGENRVLIFLPFASLLWVNLHGSFLILPLLVGPAAIGGGGNRKFLALALLSVLLVTLINPDGFAVWREALITIRNSSNQAYSLEWKPPINVGWQANLFFGWLLIFIPLVAYSKTRITLTEWLWFLGFGWMALSGLRYVIWFMAILVLLSAKLTAHLFPKFLMPESEKINDRLNISLGILILVFPLIFLPGIRDQWWEDSPPAISPDTPMEATAWLSRHPEFPGPLWTDFAFASYLIYALPERPVWIDSRFYPFPPEQWQRYVEITEASPNWQQLLDEEGIALLMLDVESQHKLYSAVVNSNRWCQVYQDEVAGIFTLQSRHNGCEYVGAR